MRVGLVTTSFPREPGDPAGSFVGAHARWLRRAGHDVEVVAAGSRGESTREPLDARVVRVASKLFYRGGAPEALEGGGLGTALAAAGFSLRQLAAVRRRLGDWDAVCAHWLAPSGVAVAALLASRRRRIPFLAVGHSGDVHLLKRMRLLGAAARLLARAEARLAFSSGPLASAFLTGAGSHKTTLAERLLVSPMGVEMTALPAPERRSAFRVLYLGRLVPIKGVDLLIEAFCRLRANGPAELIICGDGPARADLEAAAKASTAAADIRFVGEVRGASRDHFLAGADVLAVPSRELGDGRTEGMPVVVLEAIAAGTPVVVSATGGLIELPDSVPKVRPGDVGELARALADFRDPDKRRALLGRQTPIANAQEWSRVGTLLWRHWMAAPDRRRRWRSA